MASQDIPLLSQTSLGTLHFGGARMALLEIESGFWSIRRQIEALIGQRLANSVLQQAGANGGASFARSFFSEKADQRPVGFRACLQAYQAAGFGRFEIEVMEWPLGRLVIHAHDAFEAWMMRRHKQRPDQPVCAYTAGVLVGFINVISDRQDVVCIEHRCQAQGAKACEFELIPASQAGGQEQVVVFNPDPGMSRQINLLEMLFDHMPMGIAVIDRDFTLHRCNPTWAAFIDRYTPSQTVDVAPGANIFALEPGTEEVLVPLFERVFAGDTVRQDAVRIESMGIVSYWDIVLSPLYENDHVVGLLNVSIDATERVQADQRLLDTLSRLEQRVEERTHELSTLLDISHNLASTLELELLLDLILDQLGAVVTYDAASIMILDQDVLKILAYRGPIARKEALQIRFSLHEARANHEVIRERAPVIIADIHGEDELAAGIRQAAGDELETTYQYLRCWMGVPLIVKDRVVGMLTLDHRQPGHYAAPQAELTMAFASQAAVAIENARLYQAEQERQRELQMLLDVAAAANSSLNLDEMLATTLERLVAVVGASRAGVMMPDEKSGKLAARMLRPSRAIPPEEMAKMASTCEAVMARGEPLFVTPDAEQGLIEPGALLPLYIRGEVLGVLVIIGRPGEAFKPEQLALFKSITDHLGVAIENARLYAQAEQAAVATERSRLARDLHDAVTQTLFSASLIAEVLPKLWERNPETGQQKLDELRLLTRGALSEMRTLLLELRPDTLVDVELADLYRHLANAFTGRTRIPVTFTQEGQPALPPDVKEAFYRIVQEALNNIAKHAEASQVEIHLTEGELGVFASIRDDGRGFDVSALSPENLGLKIMRERAEAVHAQLNIESAPGDGTHIHLHWQASEEHA